MLSDDFVDLRDILKNNKNLFSKKNQTATDNCLYLRSSSRLG
jgi:hypothetical protein